MKKIISKIQQHGIRKIFFMLYNVIGDNTKILFQIIKHKNYRFGFLFLLSLFNFLFLREKSKLIVVKFDNLSLISPNNLLCFQVLSEVFIFHGYKKLHSCSHVLDIGGYIGESAIYLSKINKQVTVYEPNKVLFSVLEKNCAKYDNITCYNKFVSTKKTKNYMHINSNYDSGGYISDQKSDGDSDDNLIESESIYSILESNSIDGLKMDIEGGEFEILAGLITEEKFTFNKGIIEFHFTGTEAEDRYSFFSTFLQFLENHDYIHYTYDNFGKNEEPIHIIGRKKELCNLYFEKAGK